MRETSEAKELYRYTLNNPKVASIEEYRQQKGIPEVESEKTDLSRELTALNELERTQLEDLVYENERLMKQRKRKRKQLRIVNAKEKRRNELRKNCAIAILSIVATIGSIKFVDAAKIKVYSWKQLEAFAPIRNEAGELLRKYTSRAGAPDSSTYQWQYSAAGVSNEINNKFSEDIQTGQIFLAALDMNLLPFAQWNMNAFVKGTDSSYVNDADTYLEYVQSLGFETTEEYKTQMVNEYYQLVQEGKGVTR